MSSLTVADWGLVPALNKTARSVPAGSTEDPTTLVELVLKEITDRLERGETVKLSSFGSLEVRQKSQRIGRNPRTGKEAAISPRRVMLFKPSAGLRQRTTQGHAATERPSPKLKSGRKFTHSEKYDVAKLAGTKTHVVVVPANYPLGQTVARVVERVPEIVAIRRQELTEKNIDALVDLYLKDDPISEARIAIETDNARERARFLTEVTCLTSKQLAEYAGHQAANASVTGSRWKQQGRVFSLPWKGNELYPAFQFRDGQPHPTIARALRELPKEMSPWQIAFWFVSSNGWLEGATPASRLDHEAAVTMAAQRENEPIVG